MRKIFLAALLLVLVAAQAAFAGEEYGKLFLIHAKTALKVDDAQICAVPNIAWAALSEGYKVAILFDASGVRAIKKGGLFGGNRTPLDKASLPQRERDSLASQLGIPLGQVPHNYGEYIRFLKEKKGVDLYANRTMMLLYKIRDDEIDPTVRPIGLKQMIKLFQSADCYVSY